MATAIFIGLVCIADAVGHGSGHEMSDRSLSVAAFVFIFCIVFDLRFMSK